MTEDQAGDSGALVALVAVLALAVGVLLGVFVVPGDDVLDNSEQLGRIEESLRAVRANQMHMWGSNGIYEINQKCSLLLAAQVKAGRLRVNKSEVQGGSKVEQRPVKPTVAGSSPAPGAKYE
jgi:hypothetical protein